MLLLLLVCPEHNEDLFLLNLRLEAPAILARSALSAEAACRIVCSSQLDVSRRLAFLHGAAQYPTCPDQDVLDRAREDPVDEAGALAVRRPALFHPSSEARLGRASIHREPAL